MTEADDKDSPDAGSGAAEGQLKRLSNNSALRYLLAGGAAFLLDFGLLALFHEVFGWEVWLASGLAFMITFAFNFVSQKLFTFGSTTQTGSSLFKFTLLVIFNTGATIVIVTLLSMTPAGWALGKIVSTSCTTVWNYFIYRYWVFAPVETASDQSKGKAT